MESKLRALKVAELKDLLTRAKVPIPAKANKPDLIDFIIKTPAALAKFEELHGKGSARPSGASTPKPPAAQVEAADKPQSIARPQENEDILAPPEPFDWSAGAEPASNSTTKAPSKPSETPTPAKPISKKEAAPATTDVMSQDSATSTSEAPKSDVPAAEEDEEMKRRRARAERFGVPVVTPKQSQAKKGTKPAPAAPKESTAAPNGKAINTKGSTTSKPIEEDPEKLKARALRFGLTEKTTHVKPSSEGVARVTGQAKPTTTKGATGQKRAAPEESLGPEEAERRRKRAERFGLPTKT